MSTPEIPQAPPPVDHRGQLEEALVEVKRVIAGQDEMLERVLVCLVAGGHLLIEGVPGLAKTLTIKTTAAVLGGSFRRVQFTPDLVPSDLVGTRIYRPDTGGIRHGGRPGLLQLPPRRRDQPCAGEGAVGPARGDAGAPGDDRPRHASRSRPVPRHGDAEPDRVRGHVSASRGTGRPVHAQGRRRLSESRRGAHGRAALARRSRRRPAGARDRCPEGSPACRPRRLRRSVDRRVRGLSRRGDAKPGSVRARRDRGPRRVRRHAQGSSSLGASPTASRLRAAAPSVGESVVVSPSSAGWIGAATTTPVSRSTACSGL